MLLRCGWMIWTWSLALCFQAVDARAGDSKISDQTLGRASTVVDASQPRLTGALAESPVQIEFNAAAYRIGELGRFVVLQASRSGTNPGLVSVDYTTKDGTALEGQDYLAHHGTLYFEYPNAVAASLVIQIVDDTKVESTETFQVALGNPTGGAALGRNSAVTVSIVDNDAPNQPGLGVDGEIRTLATQTDGKLLVGGSFTTIHGSPRRSVARLESDLAIDESFDARLSPGTTIRRVFLAPNGDILMTGSFSNIQGIARAHLARFKPTGALDPTFAPTFVPAVSADTSREVSVVDSVAVLPDGKILVGGHFTEVDGVLRVGVARLNADGTVDRNFSHGSFLSRPEDGGFATDLGVQLDGRILMSGRGNTLRDIYSNTLLRLEQDGGLDNDFRAGLSQVASWGGIVPFHVGLIRLLRNGQLLVVEESDLSDKTSGSPVIRLDPNGSEDFSFEANSPWTRQRWSNRAVHAVLEGDDGAIWVGGPRLLARLRADGVEDATATTTLGSESPQTLIEYDSDMWGHVRTLSLENPSVNALALKSDGHIVIGGNFISYNGRAVYGLVEVFPDGTPAGRSVPLALRLESLQIMPNGLVRIVITVPKNREVVIHRSTDLRVWVPVLTEISATNRLEVTDPEPVDGPARFYQVSLKSL